MEDHIIRAITKDGTVRAFAAYTKGIVDKASGVHNLSPVASAALGRTLTALAMMSCFLKGQKDTLTIQIKGDGPLGGIVAVSDSHSNVRGYVHNNQVETTMINSNKIDVGSAVGKNGYINVIKDFGLKEPYIGFVNLVSGEIAEDLTYYFANSEQTPSIVALGVLFDKDCTLLEAGGFIIQLLPGAQENIIEHLEKKMSQIESVTALLSKGETPESILNLILGELGVASVEKLPCSYKCNCSRERMENNLITLGTKEIEEIIEDVGEADIQCHFCNKEYKFHKDDLNKILRVIEDDKKDENKSNS